MSHVVVTRKITASDLFNCSDLSDFIASIIQILAYKGSSMSRFYICEIDGIQFLTKVGFYMKTPPELYGKIEHDTSSHIDAEIKILEIFKKRLVDKNITQNIIELVYFKICKGLQNITPRTKICEQLLLDYRSTAPEDDVESMICRYVDLVKNGLAYDKCAFLVLDKCDMSLDKYLRKSVSTSISIAVFKSILFQIIYTMWAINKLYPKFRHYDLHTENIMLKFDPNYKFKASNPKFLVFTIRAQKYSVPYFGIIPKIIDFGFSILPEEKIISNVVEDRRQMYFRADNDLLFLFHWIHHTLVNTGSDKLGKIDKILQQLEPNRTYVQYYTEYIRTVAKVLPTYDDMIDNSLWSEYKKFKAPQNQIYNEFSPIDK